MAIVKEHRMSIDDVAEATNNIKGINAFSVEIAYIWQRLNLMCSPENIKDDKSRVMISSYILSELYGFTKQLATKISQDPVYKELKGELDAGKVDLNKHKFSEEPDA